MQVRTKGRVRVLRVEMGSLWAGMLGGWKMVGQCNLSNSREIVGHFNKVDLMGKDLTSVAQSN